jgi:hypothetical protein
MSDRVSLPLRLVAAGIVSVAVGTLLPWASASGTWIWGIQAKGGPFNLAVALVSLLLLATYLGAGPLHPGPRVFLISQFVASWCCLVLIFDNGGKHATFGYYLSLTGALVWLVSAWWEWRRSVGRRRKPWQSRD